MDKHVTVKKQITVWTSPKIKKVGPDFDVVPDQRWDRAILGRSVCDAEIEMEASE